MVYLCVLNLSIPTSLGEKVYAGKNIDASFNALFKSLGNCGSSAETPSMIWKSPSFDKNKVALFGR